MFFDDCVITKDVGCIHASFSPISRKWTCPYISATGKCELVQTNQSRRYVK